MKRIRGKWLWPVLGFAIAIWGGAPAWAAPTIGATAGILIDLDSGNVLWEKEADLPLPPASTTKVMTALLTENLANPEDIFTVSEHAAAVGESSAHLTAGEKLAMEDLLAAALIISANDACYALGENVAGSEPLFIRWMNVKAAALGGANSYFRNTNGLPDAEHVMSVRDLATYARRALANPLFAELVDTTDRYTETGAYRRYLKTTNRLLRSVEAVDGVKTGTTDAAGACLVASMSQGDRRVLAVVFHSPDRFGEALNLLNYGIDSFQTIRFAKMGEIWGYYNENTLLAAGDGIATLPLEHGILSVDIDWKENPVLETGATVGWLTLKEDGEARCRVNLILKNGAKKQGTDTLLEKIKIRIAN